METEVSPSPMINYVEPEDGEGGLPLRDYWRAVRKHLWLIIGFAIFTTLLMAVYMARKPDFYETRARVQVDSENNPALGSGALVVSNDPSYFSTQLQILTSTNLLHRVVKTLDLEHDQAFLSPQGNSTWQNLMGMFGLEGKRKNDAKKGTTEELPRIDTIAPAPSEGNLTEIRRFAPYVGMLRGGLDVRTVKGRNGETRLIDVALQHRDPQVATNIVNTIVKVFVRLHQERRRESGATAGEFLQKRITELQAQIRADKQRLIDYGKRHQFIALEPGQDTVVARLVGLNNELLTAENDLKMAEAEKEASLAPEAVEVKTLEASAGLESKKDDLLQKRAELLVENTEEWPAVKELDGKIAELDKQIIAMRERAGTTLTTNLTKRYRQAKEREQKLRASYEQQRRETIVQNEAAINYRIIEQEIGTNEGLLKDLYLRMGENDAKLHGIGEMPNNISVLDYAQVPGQPIGPKRMQNVVLAFVLSLGAGIGFAIFLSFLDHSIHSIDEVERKLHLPALGAIPLIGNSSRRRLLPGVGALQRRNGNGHDRPLLINDDARSPVAEAYRHLRTSVLMSVAGRAPKTLLVTSSQPSEGKTTTVVNMAMVLAQTGASVLMIDADMRRPSLHSIFNLENDRGLSTYLSSGMSEAEALSMIERTGESNLYVLTSGPPPPNPAELLGSEPMHRLIRSVESAYTHIIIDSPPVAYFTDSVLVSLLVDGVLLVVNSGSTSREIVRHSRKVLQDVGAKIFGVVLNGVKEDSTHEYYYSRGYY